MGGPRRGRAKGRCSTIACLARAGSPARSAASSSRKRTAASSIAKTPLGDTSRHGWGFLALMVAVIPRCVVVPDLVLFLPDA